MSQGPPGWGTRPPDPAQVDATYQPVPGLPGPPQPTYPQSTYPPPVDGRPAGYPPPVQEPDPATSSRVGYPVPPQRRPRPRVLPTVVIVTVCALVFAASGVLLSQPGTALDHLLPTDGRTSDVRLHDQTPAQLEQAVLARSQLNGHGLLAAVVQFSRAEEDLRRTTWLRASVKPASAPVVIVLGVLDGRMSLDGVSVPGQGVAFHPGIVLAEDGKASSEILATQRVNAVAAEDRAEIDATVAVTTDAGCRRARIDLPAGVTPSGVQQIALSVCDGLGLTAFELTGSAGRFGFGPTAGAPTSGAARVAPVPTSWNNPGGWTAQEHVAFQAGGFGVERLEFFPRGDPVPRPGGGLVVYDELSRDLLGLGPPTTDPARQELQWRAHPGGVIGSLLALGDLTLAATSDKLVTAYDQNGLRVWTTRFDDVVAGDLTPDPATGRVVLVTKDGRAVSLDPHTGRPAWDVRVSTDVQRGVHVAGGRVLVVDATGAAHILTAADGRRLWSSDQFLDLSLADLDATGVYLLSRSTVFAFDADSGSPRWAARVEGVNRNALLATDGQVVVATEEQLLSLDAAGGWVRWRAAGGEFLLARDGVILTGAKESFAAHAVADGRALQTWPLRRSATDGGRCGCVPAASGVALVVPSGVVWLR